MMNNSEGQTRRFDHDRARRLAVLRDALSKSCLLELDPSGESARTKFLSNSELGWIFVVTVQLYLNQI